ncbi:MAG: hypothetical protein ABEJ96_02005, partial [Thiohalorhabdaceae bacterium]
LGQTVSKNKRLNIRGIRDDVQSAAKCHLPPLGNGESRDWIAGVALTRIRFNATTDKSFESGHKSR